MDSIIARIITLAEPSRPEAYRRYLTRLTGRDLQKKLADLEAEAGKPAPQANWRAGLRRSEVIRG